MNSSFPKVIAFMPCLVSPFPPYFVKIAIWSEFDLKAFEKEL